MRNNNCETLTVVSVTSSNRSENSFVEPNSTSEGRHEQQHHAPNLRTLHKHNDSVLVAPRRETTLGTSYEDSSSQLTSIPPILARQLPRRDLRTPSSAKEFFRSLGFWLPAFVTMVMVLATALTFSLMSQHTNTAVYDVMITSQRTSLLVIENELTGVFKQISSAAVGQAKLMAYVGVPDMDSAVGVTTVQSFPLLQNLTGRMRQVMLTRSNVDLGYVQWPSGRFIATSKDNVFVDTKQGDNVVDVYRVPPSTPSFSVVMPDLSIVTPSRQNNPLDLAMPPATFRETTTTPFELSWSAMQFNNTRGYSARCTKRGGKQNGILVVGAFTEFRRLTSYFRSVLPTEQSIVVIFDITGTVLFVVSRDEKGESYENPVHMNVENVSHPVVRACLAALWSEIRNGVQQGYVACQRSGGTKRWLATWRGSDLIANTSAVLMFPEDDVFDNVSSSARTTIVLSSIISAVCIFLVIVAALVIKRALIELQRNLRNVAFMGIDEDESTTKLQEPPKASAGTLLFSELRDTQESYITLHNAIKAFHFYVPVNVVRGVLTGTMHSGLGMSQRFLVLSFQDIEKFTTLCEQNRNDPDKVIEIVSPMFEEVSRILTQRHGTIDKYIGDCIMTYWEVGNGGANRGPREACRNAVLAAHASLFVEPLHGVRFRTGIHCGMALLGNFGSAQRFNYTAVGDTVNTASRVESLNKEFHSQALCTERVVQHLSDGDESTEGVARLMEAGIECDGNDNVPPLHFTRYVGKVQVVGKDVAIGMYQIMKRPFEGGAAERQAWEDLIGRRLEKEHAFEAVSEVLNGMIPEEQDDPTLEYLRGQVMALHYVQQSGITSYDGIWKQTSK